MTDPRFQEDGRSHRARMLAGDQYIASADADLRRDSLRAAALAQEFNSAPAADEEGRLRILRELLGAIGEGTEIRPPFHCDYGYRIRVGARTFANFGLVALDVAEIAIGDDVQIGPNVQLLTATHPVEPGPRRAKWEGSRPIAIGNNVWLGGGAIVCPGVRIGENTVVGAGTVVVRDLPANVVAVGNPARIVRKIDVTMP
jgi:maltose O-acetyltransferase